MQTESIETRIKCRIHDTIVDALQAKAFTRHDLKRATHREWSRAEWNRLYAGPTRFPHSIDKLAGVVRGLGYDVRDDGTCVPAGARQLPTRHAVPLSA